MANANQTAYTSPTTVAQSGSDWVNPSFALVDDTSYATVSTTDANYSGYLYLRGFGFSIPARATVLAIRYQTLTAMSGASIGRAWTAPVLGTTPLGAEQFTTIYNTLINTGTSYLDVSGVTAAALNSADFGVSVRMNKDAHVGVIGWSLDHVRLEVTYVDEKVLYTEVRSLGTIASSTGWANPTNALVADGVKATATAVSGSDTSPFVVNNFGFAVPADATIVDFRLSVVGALASMGATLQNITNPTSRPIQYSPSPVEKSVLDYYTFPATVITPAMVNSSAFGVSLVGYGDSEYYDDVFHAIDHITIQVMYTVPYVPGDALFGMWP